MAFSKITGQKQIKLRLAAEAQRRGSGAYMLTGPVGMGKRLIAEEFAKALMCSDSGADGAEYAPTASISITSRHLM